MKRIYLQKAKAQVARQNTIRGINKQIVLNYIRDRAPISRAEIARETALQRSTVSSLVDDLHRAGLIEETGIGASSGGRKPTLLKVRTGMPVAIGVDITPRKTTVAVADLVGNVLEHATLPTSENMHSMSEQIIEQISAFAARSDGLELAVGITVPGIADQKLGNVLYIPYFDWRDWDLAAQITKKTSLPVTIENDANAIALAELWFGHEKIRTAHSFITVLVAEGIGTGIIVDGQIYHGEQGAAGEFGHMIVGTDAPVQCSCGSRDCWEAHASETATIARYRRLSESSGSSDREINMSYLLKLAEGGDPNAVAALKETAKYLGIGISNLIVGLSPQAVVVSGNITNSWDMIADELYSLAERSVRRGLSKTFLMPSSLGDSPTLIGAFSLVLAQKFALAS